MAVFQPATYTPIRKTQSGTYAPIPLSERSFAEKQSEIASWSQPAYQPTSRVLGTTTQPPSSQQQVSGPQPSGGGDPSGQDPSSVMEQAPGRPSINYDEIFAPAFEALTQQEAASRSAEAAGISQVEGAAATQKAGLEAEQESRLAGFGQQRTEATGTTESAISSARRQASELLQGIQARYGGTTGTGRFKSEILGAQATRNIATNQAALQNTMGKIGQAENNLRTQVTNLISQSDQQLEDQKLQLRAQLNQALADVGRERGRLETEKGSMRIDALNQYQQVLAGIAQRNAQFKQQLFMQAQDAITQLDQMKSKAQQSYQVNLTPSTLGSFVSSGAVSPEQAQRGQIGTDITGKSLEDIFGAATGQIAGQETEEDALGSALGL